MNHRTIRVLFVCLGNICRSPMAEGICRQMAQERGLDGKIEIDSAAVGPWHVGEAPDARAVRLLKHHSIDISELRGRIVGDADFRDFDYVVAMDRSNLAALRQALPAESRARLYPLTHFAPHLGIEEVPDPYEADDKTFVYIYDIIESGVRGLLDDIESTHFADVRADD
jgi:protein-tyrosine phosphatase